MKCITFDKEAQDPELKQAIKVLEYFQKWRLGKTDEQKYSSGQLTIAIDLILKHIK